MVYRELMRGEKVCTAWPCHQGDERSSGSTLGMHLSMRISIDGQASVAARQVADFFPYLLASAKSFLDAVFNSARPPTVSVQKRWAPAEWTDGRGGDVEKVMLGQFREKCPSPGGPRAATRPGDGTELVRTLVLAFLNSLAVRSVGGSMNHDRKLYSRVPIART